MDAFPTLQEFVLNLIYDPSARSVFELDPEQALHAAGLGDITAADVQQVIPLVVDSAPVTGLHGLTGADDLTTGVANLDVAGAVSHLQAITAQVAFPATHVNGEVNASFGSAAAIGVADASVHSDLAFNWTGVGGLSAGDDPAQHLDYHLDQHVNQHAVSPVEHVVTGVAPTLDSGVDTIGHLPSSVPLDHIPSLDGAGLGGATSSIGTVITPDLGHVLSQDPADTVHDTVTGVTGTVSGVTGTVGDVLHGVSGVTGATGDTTQDTSHGLLGDFHL
ncbi:IniB N-terminal domain-containing protein [Actinoplanes sp. HUAS TT8]|uniref:IniB N-terminal domain-containing protein n=1 Tax=Actinoplanes sp. HUAS TT8 TaxID=3447453 RepID=UPI003F523EA2